MHWIPRFRHTQSRGLKLTCSGNSPIRFTMGIRLLGFCSLVTVMTPVSAWPCLWIEGTTLEGAMTARLPSSFDRPGPPLAWKDHPDAGIGNDARLLKSVMRMQPSTARSEGAFTVDLKKFPPDWVKGTDEALEPIFRGDYGKARENLMALQAAHPENYYLCANLAVVCELAGEDAVALQWVEKAIQLKPDAHFGTEWMHAAVLRAKLALGQDPAWLEKNTLTGIPLGELPRNFRLADGSKILTLRDIEAALVAHAVPRLLFVKPQDRIAAAMLFELARVEARITSVEVGLEMLGLAETYGKTGTEILREEWKEILPGALRRFFRSYGGDPAMYVFLFVSGMFLLALVMLIRGRLRLRRIRSALSAKWEALPGR